MINKKNIWFLTLFSLILVLSVYYITMPKELLLNNLTNVDDVEDTNEVSLEITDAIEALKVEDEEKKEKEMETLKEVLNDSSKSSEEKNEAFEKMKSLDINSSKEEEINTKIKEEFKYEAFTKIDGDNIKVVVSSNKKSPKIANNIMRFIQKMYDTKKYITVEFK